VPPAHAVHSVHDTAAGWAVAASIVVVALLAYLRAVRTRRDGGRGWPRWRTACFAFGLVLVAVAVSPAVTAEAHDPRAHVVQHLLLGMFGPIALVLAAPMTLVLGALPPARRRTAAAVLRSRTVHVLTHPVPAAVLDMGGLYVLHLTPLYALSTANPLVHTLVGLHFLLAGSAFAWSIAGPDPAPHRPGIAVRAVVLVVAGAAHGYLAKLLYAQAAVLPPGLAHDPAANEAAAQLLYYGGDVAEVALAVALFATWYRRRARLAQSPGAVFPSSPFPSSRTRGARSG
jgi:putative membrane protein